MGTGAGDDRAVTDFADCSRGLRVAPRLGRCAPGKREGLSPGAEEGRWGRGRVPERPSSPERPFGLRGRAAGLK